MGETDRGVMRDIAHGPPKKSKEQQKESRIAKKDMSNNTKIYKITDEVEAPRRAFMSNLRKNVSFKKN